MARVLLAGILGGIALFGGGAISHMVLTLESRKISRLPDESAVSEFVSQQKLDATIYGYPQIDPQFDRLSSADQKVEFERVNNAYRQGPAGYLIVAPTGEDMAGPRQFISELVSDILAATLAAFIAAHLSSYASFLRRWLLIALMAPVAWLSLLYSYSIWYRFPLPFVLDGLFGALVEWVLAGAVIAAVVRPIMHSR